MSLGCITRPLRKRVTFVGAMLYAAVRDYGAPPVRRGPRGPVERRLDLLAERVSGPHPGFNMSEQEFCALVTPLLD